MPRLPPLVQIEGSSGIFVKDLMVGQVPKGGRAGFWSLADPLIFPPAAPHPVSPGPLSLSSCYHGALH